MTTEELNARAIERIEEASKVCKETWMANYNAEQARRKLMEELYVGKTVKRNRDGKIGIVKRVSDSFFYYLIVKFKGEKGAGTAYRYNEITIIPNA